MSESVPGLPIADSGESAATQPAGRARHFIFGRAGAAALALLVVGGLLALFGYGLLRQQGGAFAGPGVNSVGQVAPLKVRPAPDFTLALFDGGRFRLSEQRGHPVVVNYWASWCPPCRDEAPVLEAGWRTYRAQGVVFVGADIWDAEGDARAFLREFDVSYPNGTDVAGSTPVEYGLTGIPETYFVDRDGKLVRRWIGPLNERQLSAFVEEILR